MNNTTLEESVSQEECIKKDSNFLRGTINENLNNYLTGSLPPDDAKIVKFHGSYLQHDRDLEKERRRQKLEPLYQFMTRVRATGGVTSPAQWLVLDKLAEKYGNGTLKLTTRQSFQFHGILKRNLKATIKSVNDILLTTIATCGGVNRNVMCNPNPYQSVIHQQVYQCAIDVSDRVASTDGKEMVRDFVDGAPKDADALGRTLAQKLINHGADRILAALEHA